MKHWIPKRRDQRHSTPKPSSRRCRARRLAFEHCEDRCLLSGNPLTTEAVSISPVQEGGFITVNANSFLLNGANDFLLEDVSFSSLTVEPLLVDQWNFIRAAGISRLDFRVAPEALPDDAGSNITISTVSQQIDVTVPVHGISITDTTDDAGFDQSLNSPSSEPQVQKSFVEPANDSISGNDENVKTLEVASSAATNNRLTKNKPTSNRPTSNETDTSQDLADETAELLAITLPVQVITNQPTEGGAIEVAQAVASTQRAYETQLSALIASNLDRDGFLPTSAPPRAQPVVAELARAVVFETVAQHDVFQVGSAEQAAEDRRVEPPQATPTAYAPVSAQRNDSPANRTGNSRTGDSPTGLSLSAKELAERMEDEQSSAQAATFAQWPTLATVITGYLLIERRSPSAAQMVQTPPRRQHGRQGQKPAK